MTKKEIEVIKARLVLAVDKARNSKDKSALLYIDNIEETLECVNEARPEVPAGIVQTSKDIYFSCGECDTYLYSLFTTNVTGYRPRYCNQCGAKINYGSNAKND